MSERESGASDGAPLSLLTKEGESEAVAKTALRLVRALRRIRQRTAEIEDVGMDASAFRKAFHEIVRIMPGVIAGRIVPESVASLLEILDKAGCGDKMDGGPGSGNHGHKGVPGQRGGSAPSGSAGSSGSSGSSNSSGSSSNSGNASGGTSSGTSGKKSGASSGGPSGGAATGESDKSVGKAKAAETSKAESGSSSGQSSQSSTPSSEQTKAGETASGNASNSGSNNSASPSSTVSATGSNHFEKGFSKSNLRAHWGGSHGHKDQYPDMTKQEYAERALDLIQKPTGDAILGYKNASGQIVRYDKSTNDFVKGKPDMGIATMFKPKDGEAYFNRWLGKEGVKDE